ncbi:hypothetical protein O59_002150 [Cellvibrio sp. BR]|nr:hypothetical protein O59_002150 [Cellvibrio sp. BR]
MISSLRLAGVIFCSGLEFKWTAAAINKARNTTPSLRRLQAVVGCEITSFGP